MSVVHYALDHHDNQKTLFSPAVSDRSTYSRDASFLFCEHRCFPAPEWVSHQPANTLVITPCVLRFDKVAPINRKLHPAIH